MANRLMSRLRDVKEEWGQILLALFLGVVVWGLVEMRRTEERVVDCSVMLVPPPGWELRDKTPPKVAVTVLGPRSAIESLSSAKPQFRPGLEAPQAGTTRVTLQINLRGETIRDLPRELTPGHYRPEVLLVEMYRLEMRHIPLAARVSVNYKSFPAEPSEALPPPKPGYVARKVTLEPASVLVSLPADQQFPDEFLETADIDVTGKEANLTGMTTVRPKTLKGKDDAGRDVACEAAPADKVFYTVEIAAQPGERVVDLVPVRVLQFCATPLRAARIDPPTVDVTLAGEDMALQKVTARDVLVFIDLGQELDVRAGVKKVLPVEVRPPAGFALKQVKPATVTATFEILSEEGRK